MCVLGMVVGNFFFPTFQCVSDVIPFEHFVHYKNTSRMFFNRYSITSPFGSKVQEIVVSTWVDVKFANQRFTWKQKDISYNDIDRVKTCYIPKNPTYLKR